MSIEIREINFSNFKDRWQLINLLISNNIFLDFKTETDTSVGLFFDDTLIITGSIQGNVIKGFAILEGFEKLNFTSLLLEELIKKITCNGFKKHFVYIPTKYRRYFECLGYRFVSKGTDSIMLEYGTDGIDDYLNRLKEFSCEEDDLIKGSIVINGNPFTLGHREIIEKASLKCDILYLFVVKDDDSFLPYPIRKKLIVEGTKDLENICIIDGGDYVISRVTFPGYYARKMHSQLLYQMHHDLDIFSRYIAPALGISKRFTGIEHREEMTSSYNRIMEELLIKEEIETIEFERRKLNDSYISASKVRYDLKNNGNWSKYLPKSTINFFNSTEGRTIIRRKCII